MRPCSFARSRGWLAQFWNAKNDLEMKLKSRSCSKFTANPRLRRRAKVVKCPCGKTTASAWGGTLRDRPGSDTANRTRETSRQRRRTTARPAPQPSAPAPNPQFGFGAMGFGQRHVDELTEPTGTRRSCAERPGTDASRRERRESQSVCFGRDWEISPRNRRNRRTSDRPRPAERVSQLLH